MADQVGLLRIGFAFSGIVAIVVIVAAIARCVMSGIGPEPTSNAL
jgi:hypothetical protein